MSGAETESARAGDGVDVTPQNSSGSQSPSNNTAEKLSESPPYDLLLTLVSGSHVPVGDAHGKSDVYIFGKLKNVQGIVPNEPQPSRVHFRTSTSRSTRDPEWNEKWRFGGVREGTYLKLKLFDEDPRKKEDDKLGSIKVELKDFKNTLLDGQEHTRNIPIRGHKGKKHIQVLTAFFDLCNPESHIKAPEPHITIKLQLLPPENASILNVHLQRPTRYSIHPSPLANLVTSTPSRKQAIGTPNLTTPKHASDQSKPSTPKKDTMYKAYKITLIHPPPFSSLKFEADESHAKAFDPSKVRYRLFRRLIKKQYQGIYGHDAKTVYGSWWEPEEVGPGLVGLLEPLENKLFTFVITREGEWRFCETGDEYRINNLSKHSMHADGKDTVAWGGEFFVRKNEKNDKADEISNGSEQAEGYTIVLDNDSGTYSPSKDKIDEFKKFMARNLIGLNVEVRNFKDDKLKKEKKEQKGKTEGKEGNEESEQDEKIDEGEGEQKKENPRRLVDVINEEGERRKKQEAEKQQQGSKVPGTEPDVNLL